MNYEHPYAALSGPCLECGEGPEAHADTPINREVQAALRALNPMLIARIATNQMPDCFTPTRGGYVALAILLIASMQQTDRLIESAKSTKH